MPSGTASQDPSAARRRPSSRRRAAHTTVGTLGLCAVLISTAFGVFESSAIHPDADPATFQRVPGALSPVGGMDRRNPARTDLRTPDAIDRLDVTALRARLGAGAETPAQAPVEPSPVTPDAAAPSTTAATLDQPGADGDELDAAAPVEVRAVTPADLASSGGGDDRSTSAATDGGAAAAAPASEGAANATGANSLGSSVTAAVTPSGGASAAGDGLFAPASVAAAAPQDVASVLALVNAVRAGAQVAPVVSEASLAVAAQSWAEHLAATATFEHEPLEPFLGRFHTVGENLAQAPGIAEAHAGLVASPGHLANMVNPAFTAIGIGIARTASGQLVICQLFGG